MGPWLQDLLSGSGDRRLGQHLGMKLEETSRLSKRPVLKRGIGVRQLASPLCGGPASSVAM